MKSVLSILAFFILILPLTSQPISKDELDKGQKEIQFINYSGPYYYTDTADQIRSVGTALARGLKSGALESEFSKKYKVLHILDESIKTGLDADIFIVEPDAPVDNIDTLRLMISAYLSEMYGYNVDDAALLSRFISYYNAVFRGDMAYLSGRYKAKVMAELTAETAGLSTYYKDWPGKSRIIIPLNFLKQLDSKLETIELSDQKVVDQIKSDNASATDERKDLVDLQQKEIDAENKVIDEKLAQNKDAAATTDTTAASDKTASDSTASNTSDTASTSDLTTRKDQLTDQQATVDASRTDIAKDEAARLATATSDNQSTATSTSGTSATTSTAAATASSSLPALMVTAPRLDALSKLVVIDPKTGAIAKESELNSIQNRQYFVLSGSFLAIAGEKGGNRTVRLVLIDPTELKTKIQSEVDVFSGSVVLIDGSKIYAVSEVSSKYYLSVFDAATLKETARSEITVFAYTSIKSNGTNIFVQTSDKAFVVLDKTSLKKL